MSIDFEYCGCNSNNCTICYPEKIRCKNIMHGINHHQDENGIYTIECSVCKNNDYSWCCGCKNNKFVKVYCINYLKRARPPNEIMEEPNNKFVKVYCIKYLKRPNEIIEGSNKRTKK